MEFKWFGICATVLIAGLAVDCMVGKYSQSQCRVAAIYTGMAADDIAKVCK